MDEKSSRESRDRYRKLREDAMFSINQKRIIANRLQQILRETGHPELPDGEIQFLLHVQGAEAWSWADIRNNGAVDKPDVNPWNEAQAKRGA